MRCFAIIDGVSVRKGAHYVHVVSHGPQCLDGVTAAVVVARFHDDATVIPYFSSNSGIDQTLLSVDCQPASGRHSLWITDISWSKPAVDRHLAQLQKRGVAIYWIDHHRTAIERYRNGEIGSACSERVLDESYAAARLTFDFLSQRQKRPEVAAGLRQLVNMADDNDRWLHRIPGSRELAQAVSVLRDEEAYEELLHIGPEVAFTPLLQAALRRVETELRRSLALALASRTEHALPDGITLVSAVCDGYTSDIADRWNQGARQTVFAFYDLRSAGLSLRRSPDCHVDLSTVARRLGGGGHPAAAGCELPEARVRLATVVAGLVMPAVSNGSNRSS